MTCGIILTYAWWSDYSCELLLEYYGYDFNAEDKFNTFKHVDSSNLKEVRQLELQYYGIGWLLKGAIMYPFYLLYVLITYFVGKLRYKLK